MSSQSPHGPGVDRLEFVGLHLDPTAVQQWGVSSRPDEEVMVREECRLANSRMPNSRMSNEVGGEGWAWLLEELLVFLFADGKPEEAHLPALRAWAVMRGVLPVMLQAAGRPALAWDGVKVGLLSRSFAVGDFREMVEEDEGWERALRAMMEYLYPASGEGWMWEGTKRLYLVARKFNAPLVSVPGKLSRDRMEVRDAELNFTRMAEIFGEECGGEERARWSARMKRVVRDPIEQAGGVSAAGKRASTCQKYAEAAKGNRNRRGRKAAGGGVPSDQSAVISGIPKANH